MATFGVDTASEFLDPNDAFLSLRKAIALANDETNDETNDAGKDQITFDTTVLDGGGTISLGGTQPELNSSIAIDVSELPTLVGCTASARRSSQAADTCRATGPSVSFSACRAIRIVAKPAIGADFG